MYLVDQPASVLAVELLEELERETQALGADADLVQLLRR